MGSPGIKLEKAFCRSPNNNTEAGARMNCFSFASFSLFLSAYNRILRRKSFGRQESVVNSEDTNVHGVAEATFAKSSSLRGKL